MKELVRNCWLEQRASERSSGRGGREQRGAAAPDTLGARGAGKGTASRETSSDIPFLLCSGRKVFCVLVNTLGCIKELAAPPSAAFSQGQEKRLRNLGL